MVISFYCQFNRSQAWPYFPIFPLEHIDFPFSIVRFRFNSRIVWWCAHIWCGTCFQGRDIIFFPFVPCLITHKWEKCVLPWVSNSSIGKQTTIFTHIAMYLYMNIQIGMGTWILLWYEATCQHCVISCIGNKCILKHQWNNSEENICFSCFDRSIGRRADITCRERHGEYYLYHSLRTSILYTISSNEAANCACSQTHGTIWFECMCKSVWLLCIGQIK